MPWVEDRPGALRRAESLWGDARGVLKRARDAAGPVIEAWREATATTRRMLLRRRAAWAWVPVGFAAVLDQAGASNLQFAGRLATGEPPPWVAQWTWFEPGGVLEAWSDAAAESPHQLVAYVLGFLVAVAAGMALLTGIGSIGQFLFARVAARGTPGIGSHLRGSWGLIGSLWRFRLFLFAVSFVLFIPFLITGMLWIAQAGSQGVASWSQLVVVLAPLAAAWSVVGVGFLCVNSVTRNLVVPIMEREACDCIEAWVRCLGMMQRHLAACAMFFAVRLVVLVVFAAVASVVSVMLCCLGFIPLVHHIVFAPYYLFDRALGTALVDRLEPGPAEHSP